MNIKFVYVTVIVVLAAMVAPVAAQQKLGSVITDMGLDWLVDSWVGTMGEDGPDIKLEWKWGAGRHAIHAEHKIGEYLASGMIMYVVSREEVVEIGTNSMGASSKGLWNAAGGRATVSYMHTKASGETEQYEVIYKKIDSETIEATMYDVAVGGQRHAQPRGVVKLKRKSAKTEQSAIRWHDYDSAKRVAFDPNGSPVMATAVIKSQEGKEDVAQKELIDLVAYAHACDGCLLFNLHKKRDGVFMLYEVWRDMGALKAFGKSSYVQYMFSTAGEWGADAPEFIFWKTAR